MDQIYNAITPPTLAIAGLRAAISQEIPNLSFVFDPDLEWPSAAQGEREMRDMEQDSGEDVSVPDQSTAPVPTQFPLMAWNRSTLRPQDGRIRRGTFAAMTTVQVSGQDWNLQALFGQIEFNFRIFARDVLELEAIEIGYSAKSLISDITGFFIPVASLYPAVDVSSEPPDSWKYDVQWNPLEEALQVNKSPTMLFAIAGSALIRGAFMTGAVLPNYLVNSIDLKIMDYQQTLDAEIVVSRLQS